MNCWKCVIFTLFTAPLFTHAKKYETLHTVGGKYDTSWHPQRFSSVEDLIEANSVSRYEEGVAWLVAFIGDDESQCANTFHPIYLRQAQRYRSRRFLRIATLYQADVDPQTWADSKLPSCAARLYQPGDTKESLVVDVAEGNWEESNVWESIKRMTSKSTEVKTLTVVNNMNVTIDIYWVNHVQVDSGSREEGTSIYREHKVLTLRPGSSSGIGSFVGHIFAAYDGHTLLGFSEVKSTRMAFEENMLQQCTADLTTHGASGSPDPHVKDQLERELALSEGVNAYRPPGMGGGETSNGPAAVEAKPIADLKVANEESFEVDVFWIDSDSLDPARWREEPAQYNVYRQHKMTTLAPYQATVLQSFEGHVFSLYSTAGEELLGFGVAEANAPLRFNIGADLARGGRIISEARSREMDKRALAESLHQSNQASESLIQEMIYGRSLETRMALSDVQSHFVPSLTKEGFYKDRLPPTTFARVTKFYKENYNTSMTNEEYDGGPLYNQRTIPTYHTPLPHRLQNDIFMELKDLMEVWAGGMKLKGTSCYGVRTYSPGSYLHLHVDTAQTHVISGIVNVAQEVSKPWPLEILDHKGKLHEVNMDPGDLLFYESAKLLHGRPQPLEGQFYANIFVHYVPEKGWDVRF